MIDWTLVVLLGMLGTISLIHYIGKHQSIEQYTYLSSRFGLNKGTLLLLMREISGTAVFLSLYLTFQFGLFGGVTLALTGLAGYFSFLHVYQRFNETDCEARFTNGASVLFSILNGIRQMEGLLFSIWFILYLSKLQDLPSFLVLALLAGYTLIYAGLGGMEGILRSGYTMILILFASIAGLSFFQYLHKGIETTFSDWSRMPQPHIGQESVPLIFVGLFVFLGRWFLDFDLWNSLCCINQKYRSPSLKITVFSWIALIMGIESIMIYAMSKEQFHSFSDALLYLLSQTGKWGSTLFALALFTTILTGMGISLHALTRSFLIQAKKLWKFSDPTLLTAGYTFSLLILLFAVFFVIGVPFRIVDGVLFYTLFYLSSFFPMLITRTSQGRIGAVLPLMILFSTGLGMLFLYMGKETEFAILASFSFSAIGSIAYRLIKKLDHNGRFFAKRD